MCTDVFVWVLTRYETFISAENLNIFSEVINLQTAPYFPLTYHSFLDLQLRYFREEVTEIRRTLLLHA
jgi:hypothetical protein